MILTTAAVTKVIVIFVVGAIVLGGLYLIGSFLDKWASEDYKDEDNSNE